MEFASKLVPFVEKTGARNAPALGTLERPRLRTACPGVVRDYNQSLLFIPGAFLFPRTDFGTGGHHVCGAGRSSALPFAQAPSRAVVPLGTPDTIPARPFFRQRRF